METLAGIRGLMLMTTALSLNGATVQLPFVGRCLSIFTPHRGAAAEVITDSGFERMRASSVRHSLLHARFLGRALDIALRILRQKQTFSLQFTRRLLHALRVGISARIPLGDGRARIAPR